MHRLHSGCLPCCKRISRGLFPFPANASHSRSLDDSRLRPDASRLHRSVRTHELQTSEGDLTPLSGSVCRASRFTDGSKSSGDLVRTFAEGPSVAGRCRCRPERNSGKTWRAVRNGTVNTGTVLEV